MLAKTAEHIPVRKKGDWFYKTNYPVIIQPADILDRKNMRFRFLLSGPRGDIELTPPSLQQPFLLSPEEEHPFLCLGDYFEAIREMLLRDNSRALISVLAADLKQQVEPADISAVLIRSEKHGAFYHIASIEVTGLAKPARLAVITGLSEQAKNCLTREYDILGDLSAQFSAEFLPHFYSKNHVEYQVHAGKEEFLMVLGEWLDGYHEWHLSQDPETGDPKIQLWDYQKGYRFLTEQESCELLRQVSYILTSYYDQRSFCQIYPWHHGAGDFVVRRENGTIGVKLITVRNHSPLLDLPEGDESSRLVAIINFLLNLTARIRLDKLDGVGAPAWMGDFAVEASVKGFFEALSRDAIPNSVIGPAELLEVLQAFDPPEFLSMYQPLLEIYSQEDADDFALILDKLPDHINQLYRVIQDFQM